jgi:hypothetical protein
VAPRPELTDLLPSALEVHAEVHRSGLPIWRAISYDPQQQSQSPDRAVELGAHAPPPFFLFRSYAARSSG